MVRAIDKADAMLMLSSTL